MNKLLSIINDILPTEIIWRMFDEKIYLTFDDGPDDDVTPKLLDLLNSHQIPATFFVVGQKVKRYPEIVNKISAAGHTLGNHTFSHPKMLWKSKEALREEITRTDDLLFKITNKKPVLFRPPYGKFGWQLLSVAKTTNHKIVLWNALTRDYKTQNSVANIHQRIIKCMRPGAIVVLHDRHRNGKKSLEALEKCLDLLKNTPLKFAALPN